MWLRHWGLARDPFGGPHPTYVPMPSHDEAIARMVFAIERQQRSLALFAEAGLGKTTVLRRAIRELRGPHRRIVPVPAPSDGSRLLGLLADGMGLPPGIGSDRERVWRALARAVRAAAVEGRHVVFAVDGWDRDAGAAAAAVQDLSALREIAGRDGPPVSWIRVGRGVEADVDDGRDAWALAVGLERLTRSEAEAYYAAKLASAGCRDRLFTPRAVARLHSWSEGVPRALDQLAVVALMAGAMQGIEVVTPDVVDGVALRTLAGVDGSLSSR